MVGYLFNQPTLYNLNVTNDDYKMMIKRIFPWQEKPEYIIFFLMYPGLFIHCLLGLLNNNFEAIILIWKNTYKRNGKNRSCRIMKKNK